MILKKVEIEKGSELVFKTKNGGVFEGIFLDIKGGYLHTIMALGIFMAFPVSSILTITKL